MTHNNGTRVWLSMGTVNDDLVDDWGRQGGSGFAVPSRGDLLVVYRNSLDPVELWRIADTVQLAADDRYTADGYTYFASSTYEPMLRSGPRDGSAFGDYVFAQGWVGASFAKGAPYLVHDRDVPELLDWLDWADLQAS